MVYRNPSPSNNIDHSQLPILANGKHDCDIYVCTANGHFTGHTSRWKYVFAKGFYCHNTLRIQLIKKYSFFHVKSPLLRATIVPTIIFWMRYIDE